MTAMTKLRRIFQLRWLWEIVGGCYLFAYLFWYIPPSNRVVPHWPLDFAITAISGALLLYFGFNDVLQYGRAPGTD
jgi:hypothetical protein